MKFLNLAALTLVISLAAGSAFAADAPPPADGPGDHGHAYFMRADTNGDGFISKAEWRTQSDKKFDEIDTNHDGKVSRDEMKAYHEAMREKRKEHHAEHQAEHGGPGSQGTPSVAGSH
jgi:hypothetical protein